MGRYRRMKNKDVTTPKPQGAKASAANKKMASKYGAATKCERE